MDPIATYRIAEPRGVVTGAAVPGAPSEWDVTGVIAQVERAAVADAARASLVARVFAAASAVAPVTTGPELMDRMDDLLPHLPDGGVQVQQARADLLPDGSVTLHEVGHGEAVVFQYATLSELIGLLRDGRREVLLQTGSCAVYRTAAGIFVTGDADDAHGRGLSGPSTRQGLADGRWVVAGRLPDGATRAIEAGGVAVQCANGVWLAVTRAQEFAVRFEDDGGTIIAQPHPADWPREAVRDATEDCAACGAREWEHLVALDGSRGASNGGPSGIVVCARCGYEVGMPAFMRSLETDRTEPPPAAVRERIAARRRELREDLRRVTFLVYGLAGESATLGGYGSSGGTTNTVTVKHAGCAVTSSVDPPHPRELEDALPGLLHRDPWPELSEPALSLWLDARDRERNRTVAAATRGTQTLAVDGEPVRFDTLQHGELTAAAASVGPVRILLAGQWPAGAELRRVADPAALD